MNKDDSKQDFANFVASGALGTPSMMRRVWQWLISRLAGADVPMVVDAWQEDMRQDWKGELEKLTAETALRGFLAKNPSLQPEIMGEIAAFIQETNEKTNINQGKNLIEEQLAWEEFAELQVSDFGANYSQYFETISRYYPDKSDFGLDFYAGRLRRLQQEKELSQTEMDKIAVLHEHIRNEWQTRLQTRQFAAELEWISQQRERFLLNLYNKIEKYEALQESLRPLGMNEEFGRLWDMSKGGWKRSDARILEKYADMLRRNPHLQKIATLLGKLRAAENEFEVETIATKQQTKETRYNHAQKEEFIGIRLSDEIAHAMPSELAMLADAQTESIFIKRWAEKKLQTWQYRAKYLSEKTETSFTRARRPKASDKGAFIICVDTSASMQGQPEQVAKALCFAILKIAIKEKRDCFVISFSTGIKTLDMSTVGQSIPALIDFLNMSFQGGTDATPALTAALEQLNRKKYQKSDVIMISDFVMPSLPDDLGKKMLAAKRDLKTKFFSLSITRDQNANVLNYFDHNWVYNPSKPENLLQLMQNLAQLKKD
jgi:uncharacterized protein with von Willebrand factor type A (vWA) domain